jgi:hypothetical protein
MDPIPLPLDEPDAAAPNVEVLVAPPDAEPDEVAAPVADPMLADRWRIRSA